MQLDALSRERLLVEPARFVDRRRARFQEIDAAGIVFFPRFLEWMHDAYVAWLEAIGFSLAGALAEGRIAVPLRETRAEFLAPVRFDDAVGVGLVAAALPDGAGAAAEVNEVVLGWRVEANGRVAVLGWTRHVSVERATFRRAPLPKPLVAALRVLATAPTTPPTPTG